MRFQYLACAALSAAMAIPLWADSLTIDAPEAERVIGQVVKTVNTLNIAPMRSVMADDVLAWDRGKRIEGKDAVEALFGGLFPLCAANEFASMSPRIAFDGDRAVFTMQWQWCEKLGGARQGIGVGQMNRAGASWMLTRVDLFGSTMALPDPEFNPKPTVESMKPVVALLDGAAKAVTAGQLAALVPLAHAEFTVIQTGGKTHLGQDAFAAIQALAATGALASLSVDKMPIAIDTKTSRALAHQPGIAGGEFWVLAEQQDGVWKLRTVSQEPIQESPRAVSPKAHLPVAWADLRR